MPHKYLFGKNVIKVNDKTYDNLSSPDYYSKNTVAVTLTKDSSIDAVTSNLSVLSNVKDPRNSTVLDKVDTIVFQGSNFRYFSKNKLEDVMSFIPFRVTNIDFKFSLLGSLKSGGLKPEDLLSILSKLHKQVKTIDLRDCGLHIFTAEQLQDIRALFPQSVKMIFDSRLQLNEVFANQTLADLQTTLDSIAFGSGAIVELRKNDLAKKLFGNQVQSTLFDGLSVKNIKVIDLRDNGFENYSLEELTSLSMLFPNDIATIIFSDTQIIERSLIGVSNLTEVQAIHNKSQVEELSEDEQVQLENVSELMKQKLNKKKEKYGENTNRFFIAALVPAEYKSALRSARMLEDLPSPVFK